MILIGVILGAIMERNESGIALSCRRPTTAAEAEDTRQKVATLFNLMTRIKSDGWH